MKTLPLLNILLAFILLVIVSGCSNSSDDSSTSSSAVSSDSSDASDSSDGSDTADDSDDDSETTNDTSTDSAVVSPYAVSVAETARTYDTDDVVDNLDFDIVVNVDFTENTVRLSSETAQAITTDGVTLLTVDGASIGIAQTDYGITITSSLDAGVKYNLTGELGGTLSVISGSFYQLYLDGVTISATAGPALDLESSQKAFIVSASGTTNVLEDASSRSMTMKAALFGNGPMILSGNGAFLLTGNYKHGVFSGDYIRIRGGELDVAVSTKDAVRAVNGFIFDDGDLVINASGTTTDDESKGIKVEGEESSTGAGKGYIVINGGYITITSVDKAITAGWDIDDDAQTTDTSDDPFPYVEINNGVINITTTGTPYEYEVDGETVSCSPEGIEAKSDLTINSGYITVDTTDDALNAGDSITINGGYLYCTSAENDAIDSNGTWTIAGGVVVAVGSTAPEGAFDCDQNTFAITGGTFVGIGSANQSFTVSSCITNLGSSARWSNGEAMLS